MNLAKKKLLFLINKNRDEINSHPGVHELLIDINEGCNSTADLTQSQLDFILKSCKEISDSLAVMSLTEQGYHLWMAKMALINYVNNCK